MRFGGSLLLFLALLLGLPTAVAANPDEAARRADLLRRRLVEAARQYVDPSNERVGGLEGVQRSLDERRAVLLTPAPKADPAQGIPEAPEVTTEMVAELDLLLGRLGEDGAPRAAARGVIREGASWFRAIRGQRDTPWIEDHVLGLEIVDAEGRVRFDVEATWALVKSLRREATRRKTAAAAKKPAPVEGEAAGDGEEAPAEEPPAPEVDPEQAADQARIAEGEALLATGALRVRLPADADAAAPALRGLADLYFGRPQLESVVAFANPDELAFEESAAWLVLRGLQKKARLDRFQQARQIKSLVNQTLVDEREAVYLARKAELERLQARRTALIASYASYQDPSKPVEELILDRTAWAQVERDLNRSVGRMGFEIEAAKRAWREANPGEGDAAVEPPDAVRHQWWRLQFHETLFQQKLRLLYITVLRAEERIRVLEAGIEVTAEEMRAAQDVYETYRKRMDMTRREQQLDTLALYDDDLRSDVRHARTKAEERSGEDQSNWLAYAAQLEQLRALNEDVVSLVERRRGLSGPSIGESAPDAPDATAASDLATRRAALMNPSATKMTIEWARQHQERLGDPLYDRAVIASHHARISEFVPRLEKALDRAETPAPDPVGFRQRLAEVDRALQQLGQQAPLDFGWRYHIHQRSRIQGIGSAYKNTVSGMAEDIDAVRGRIAALEDYRRALLRQGKRSFGIRVRQELTTDNLSGAYNDAAGGLGSVLAFLTLQGDEHLGTWLRDNWLPLLGVIVLMVLVRQGVRLGRRALTRRINTLAERHPRLRSQAVSVEADAVAKQVRREREEEAMRQAEEQALSDATKEGGTNPGAPQTGEGPPEEGEAQGGAK